MADTDFQKFKKFISNLFGEWDGSGTGEIDVKAARDRLVERVVTYRFHPARQGLGLASGTFTTTNYYAQYDNVGANTTIQTAEIAKALGRVSIAGCPDRQMRVVHAHFIPDVAFSGTVSMSHAWFLQLIKVGRGLTTASTSLSDTYTTTTFIGGLTDTADSVTLTGSYSTTLNGGSGATQIGAVCRVGLTTTDADKVLGRADSLAVQVAKGGVGQSFPPGLLEVILREEK